MSKVTSKPGTMLYPVPTVMVSCGDGEKDNIITIGWSGIVNSEPPMTYVSVRKSRFSHHLIQAKKEFVINLVNEDLVKAADFCGVKSGRDIDKFAEMRLHAREIEGFPAPALDEAPAFLCCRVKQRIPLGSHDLFLCAVEQVYVKDALFDADGSLHMGRANLVSYAHGEYFPLKPRPEGFFGYSVAREDVLRRRLGAPKPAARRTPGKRNGRR